MAAQQIWVAPEKGEERHTGRVRACVQWRRVWGLGIVVALACGVGRGQQAAAGEASELSDARRAVEAGQMAAAEELLRALLRRGPPLAGAAEAGAGGSTGARAGVAEVAEAHYLLGYVLFREQRAKESLAEYTAGAGLRAPTVEELEVVASDYVLLKDFADAAKWLRYALERAPGEVRAWYLLGRAEYSLDHAAEAVTAFERCLKLQSREVRCEYNLGLAYEKVDRAEDARAAYGAAIAWQGEPGVARDAQPYLDLGMLERKAGQLAAAVGHLRSATEISPRNAKAWQELGLALDAAGKTEEAITALERASALAPGAEQPHFFLGRIFRREGREKDAAGQFREVERLVGTHSDTSTPNVDQTPSMQEFGDAAAEPPSKG